MAMEPVQPALKFTGYKYLIQRLVLATLTGRTIRVSQIRSSSHTAPGLAPHEVSFLRLLEAITNGSQIEFSYTGTTVAYKPGLVTGSATGHGASGGVIRHELPADCTRGVSWFLVPLCLLAPFSKAKVDVLFTGPGVITSATQWGDVSVDTVRTAILPLYRHFGIENNIELRVLKRSNTGRDGKGGGGEVQLVFGHQVRLPKTLHLMNAGRVKRVRGVAYSTGVAGANNARLIEAARGVLNELVPDTYIFSDVSSAPFVPAPTRENPAAKKKTGLGFGLSLVAETHTNVLYSADIASPPTGGEPPEDLGKRCAYQLLEIIEHGGCVPAVAAPTMLTLMAMGSEDVGRITVGKEVLGSEPVIQLARDLRTFGMSGWGMREGNEEGEAVVSVVGKGVGNVGRKIA
ncbi:putative RNA-3'-phosphate cyclase family protein [Teratosphaeria destructans]|uniref:RNA-3'-phosphate cyclase family protein n=1 Tax=Teratosphaeria destructans TaxID=418781 RepID=A0A9W7W574_9PEZI|nr:putative RNA-3'-phosphate cyclase family protein [Teratosphaeria destructans]